MVTIKVEYYYDSKNSDLGHCFTAFDKKNQVGICIFKEESVNNIIIDLIKVDAAYELKGVRSELLRAVFNKCKELEIREVLIKVKPDEFSYFSQKETIDYYKKVGFVEWIGSKDKDEVIMFASLKKS
jgi:GNAT superfamily N-acetyltransferase